MRVAIVGTGYVGLVTGVCLSVRGHDVTAVDVSADVVDRLNRGEPHIHERDLAPLLESVLRAGRFRATTALAEAVPGAELVLIAVGTPSVDGAIDLRFVVEAARQIGTLLRSDNEHRSIVVKSTVLPGTTDTIVRGELEAASGRALGQFGLGMNPEFLREGEAVRDFMHPDRIVLGYEDASTLDRLEALYAGFEGDRLRVNTRTAELVKYANNALLATQISTINEIANLSAALGGIDIMDVVRGVHLDGRWSPVVDGRRVSPGILRYLVPGCGFGGSCFPKDIQALRTHGAALGTQLSILGAVLAVNEDQPFQVARILAREAPNLEALSCLVLGLAFKPNTDDVRESPAFKIVTSLKHSMRAVSVHDPIAGEKFRESLGLGAKGIDFVDDWRAHVPEADVIVIVTAWDEYRELARLDLGGKIVFDARRLFDASELRCGRYLSIGRRLAQSSDSLYRSAT
jgi:UDPglucose 6-dehydrogenase